MNTGIENKDGSTQCQHFNHQKPVDSGQEGNQAQLVQRHCVGDKDKGYTGSSIRRLGFGSEGPPGLISVLVLWTQANHLTCLKLSLETYKIPMIKFMLLYIQTQVLSVLLTLSKLNKWKLSSSPSSLNVNSMRSTIFVQFWSLPNPSSTYHIIGTQ